MATLPSKKEQKELQSKNRGLMRYLRMVIVVGAIIIIAILGYTAWSTFFSKKANVKYIFAINEKKYPQTDFEDLLAKPQNVGLERKKALEAYTELKKYQYVAEKNNVVVSDRLLDEKTKELYAISTKETDFDKLNILNQSAIYIQVAPVATQQSVFGDYAGSLFVFPFARHITNYEGRLKQDPQKIGVISNYDPAQVEQDKKYAAERANYYLDKLKSNNISADDAIKEIKADARLSNVNSANESTQFGNEVANSWRNKISDNEIVNYIKTIKKPSISQLQTSKALVFNNSKKETVEARYYFVKITKVSSSKSSFDVVKFWGQFTEQVKSLKVVTYDNDTK